ncbi:hypothetical protein KO561_01690 [Radiobacillus kanasensis]|uniref:hypothetical protein n=1 Tax=Radiobacillus kanasensis TaxID=2844358 RepID=UPI001E5DFF4E|nr:hypothetical protein [Radiobacillus kanasensis]UFT99713.1 hypothetical protein KO561_01690 [Radiobacillus kanasensis]
MDSMQQALHALESARNTVESAQGNPFLYTDAQRELKQAEDLVIQAQQQGASGPDLNRALDLLRLLQETHQNL